MHYVIETGGDPSAFVPRLRSLASAVDPDAMIQGPQPLDELVAARALEERLASLMILVLAGLGAILAAAGLYAIVSFTVSQRTHEIGIRRALGAHPTRILSTIARRAALQLGAGVVLGVPLGAVLINEITADAGVAAQSVPALVGSVTVGVVLVTCLACLAPTKRGLRVRPTEALREG